MKKLKDQKKTKYNWRPGLNLGLLKLRGGIKNECKE